MKPTFKALFIALSVLIYSCEKEKFVRFPDLEGKWALYDTYYSIGGPLIYAKADSNVNIYLDFKADGSLSDPQSFYSRYQLKDSTKLILIKKNRVKETYFFKIDSGLLRLSRADGPICTEGCGARYKRESE